MPRPYVFPDPNDRSPNNPSVIVSSQQVLGLYNAGNSERMDKVTDKVRSWFTNAAKEKGWDGAQFSGGQCFLTKEFKS